MGSRRYSRRPNGRFRRATLENTFGLRAPSCPECNRLNPHGVDEPEPTNCHACGAPMRPEHQRESATPMDDGTLLADCSCGGTYSVPQGGDEFAALEAAGRHIQEASR